ncbi:MAG TPA: sulfotransferase family 2 domain-containing protein [Verrucomicrobiota bacterium]|nr:sulfotransferase family 2 domain-containing protein [Verrucomicrobiota bacterium]
MIAFVHIQKTAGQTMRAMLRKNFGWHHCDALVTEGTRPEDWQWIKKCYPSLISIAGHGVRPASEFAAEFPDARYYTILRKPSSRSLSHYQYLFERGKQFDFPTWMRLNQNLMCTVICGEQNAQRAIDTIESKGGFVGLQEHFNETLLLWKQWTGFDHLDLAYRSTNTATSNKLSRQVTSDPQHRELIQEHNQEDQKLYDHVVQVIYPRQKAAYGETLADDLKQFEQRLKSGSNSSWKSVLGKLKRNLIYRPGVRNWKADLGDGTIRAT